MTLQVPINYTFFLFLDLCKQAENHSRIIIMRVSHLLKTDTRNKGVKAGQQAQVSSYINVYTSALYVVEDLPEKSDKVFRHSRRPCYYGHTRRLLADASPNFLVYKYSLHDRKKSAQSLIAFNINSSGADASPGAKEEQKKNDSV